MNFRAKGERMKQQGVKALIQIGLLAVIAMVTAAGSAQGQVLGYKIRANIPFDFIVGDKNLPAGEYLIGRARQDSDVLVIRGVKGNANAFRSTSPVNTEALKDEATLVFHRYGDQYFLSEVWPAGANAGRMLSESRGEREARERNLAGNTATESGTVRLVSSPQ